MTRFNGRNADELRTLNFHRGFTENAEGSVLVSAGRTRVLCTASVLPGVPRWMRSKGEGWLTAEYAMLPGSVDGRKAREHNKRDGRSVEIQRLIGRSLRAAVDLSAFPEFTLHVDCDVLQADGGTRCASITGGMMAIHDALQVLESRGQLKRAGIRHWISAISVGVVDDAAVLDLDYGEDFAADVDMNIIATADGKIIEVQGTAEGAPFSREMHDQLLDLGLAGTGSMCVTMQELAAAGLEV
ncbi:MAG: ribonuclease PH [Planctomycetes bacterium]|nr:ribonuclease PH [Planctomycetota bacterium]